jgi:hypothetical protein
MEIEEDLIRMLPKSKYSEQPVPPTSGGSGSSILNENVMFRGAVSHFTEPAFEDIQVELREFVSRRPDVNVTGIDSSDILKSLGLVLGKCPRAK